MALSLKAVVYGVLDPTFASRVAAETVTTAEQWTLEEKEQIVAVRTALAERLATEVNRIEAQLSLMVSHAEGDAESKLELFKAEQFALREEWDAAIDRWRARKTYVPAALGFVVGVVVTLIDVFIR